MDIADFREFCLSLPETTESLPFDEDTLVFKLRNKMFAFTSITDFTWLSVKCQPEKLISLNERYRCISPAYHMNKRHWMSIVPNSELTDTAVKKLIVNSYILVASGLKREDKMIISELIELYLENEQPDLRFKDDI